MSWLRGFVLIGGHRDRRCSSCRPNVSVLDEAQTQKSYLLEFESMGRLAAETFELLLMMVEKCNGGEQLLAESAL